MKRRQQQEFNALPIGFAFNRGQFREMMENWGLDPEKDTDEIHHVGYGGYVRKRDMELLCQVRDRHDAELETAIAGDETGDGFIYEMFLFKLENHEFGYTMDRCGAGDCSRVLHNAIPVPSGRRRN